MVERFKAVPESETGHCCFEASVLDADDMHTIECYDLETAELVAGLLNAHYNQNGGE